MVTLPPLAALRAFEATVRLGGLARAAVELNLTTNAISHQSHTGARQLSAAGGVLSLLEDVGIGTGTVRPSRSSVGGARSPTRDQRRSWHRNDRPRGARRRARSGPARRAFQEGPRPMMRFRASLVAGLCLLGLAAPAAAAPEGTMTWGVHITLASRWLDP